MFKLSGQSKIIFLLTDNIPMRFPPLLLAVFCLPVVAQEMNGRQVYESTCHECHGTGNFDAPKLGDTKRWKKLVKEGLNDLVPAALTGIRKMPAKGGKPQLSDSEVARAVVFMANAGGGRFAEPTPSDIERWRKIADRKRKP